MMVNWLKRVLRPIYAPIVIQYRHQKAFRQQQEKIRQQVVTCYESDQPIKIVIGAGLTEFDGWIATDIPAFDILKHEHWAILFQPNTIYRMLAEHVFEHLTEAQFQDFLRVARSYLAKDGRIRIAIPDGNHPDPAYIERVRPNGTGEGAHDHKVLYTCDKITRLLDHEGYEYELVEYFDGGGQFHQIDWDNADGYIKRSAGNDHRNAKNPLSYTSLIVDFWSR